MTDKERFIAELRILLTKHQVVLESYEPDYGDMRISFTGLSWWEKAEDLIPELGPQGRILD